MDEIQPIAAVDRPSRWLPWGAASMLCWREIIRFFRQRNRVVGAVGQPLLFWFLFGVGMNRWFRVGGQSFQTYYLPGTLMLILLFTAIFATISIIEDRREGFLQSVLVAPIPRWSMVLGKVSGGAAIAMAQGLFFLALALLFGITLTPARFVALVLLMSCVAVALTCLGFVIAWKLDSTQGFHAIMNLLLMPMWLLSGAFFPVPASIESATMAETAMQWVMRLNPVTYGVAGMRQLMFSMPTSGVADAVPGAWTAPLSFCWAVSTGFAVLMFLVACLVARKHTSGDLL